MKLTVAFCAAISAFSAGAWTVMSGLQQTRTHSWQNFDLTADGFSATLPPCSVVKFLIR